MPPLHPSQSEAICYLLEPFTGSMGTLERIQITSLHTESVVHIMRERADNAEAILSSLEGKVA